MIKAFLKWWNSSEVTSAILKLAFSHNMYEVVYQSWAGGITVSSDLARREAGWVAAAASLGLITTRESDGSFGRTWYVTQAGIGYLDNYWKDTR